LAKNFLSTPFIDTLAFLPNWVLANVGDGRIFSSAVYSLFQITLSIFLSVSLKGKAQFLSSTFAMVNNDHQSVPNIGLKICMKIDSKIFLLKLSTNRIAALDYKFKNSSPIFLR
jgi:hypothetical protein